MKNYLLVTGGAGFVGSNLIKHLVKKTKYKIISIDNYSSGYKKNHIKNSRVKYIKSDTNNIENALNNYKRKIHTIFHFGEFARIHQSFASIKDCFSSNISGTSKVFYFALKNDIKIIYSATSASLGNKGKDHSLSPYAFSKSKNLQLLNHLRKWFGFSYEALYFYNVYGPGHITEGKMATVIGIFENQFKKGKPLTVVRPGNQSRKFTYIKDTVEGCFFAWKKNKNRHYALSNNRSYKILDVARLFGNNIKFIPRKLGERKKSAIVKKIGSEKIHVFPCKSSLSIYIKKFKENYE